MSRENLVAMVNHAKEGNFSDFQQSFETELTDKLDDAFEARTKELYNTTEE